MIYATVSSNGASVVEVVVHALCRCDRP